MFRSRSKSYSKSFRQLLFGIAMVALLLLTLSLQAMRNGQTNLLTQDAGVTAEDYKNQQNQIKNQQDYLKNLRREISDIQREAKNVDTTIINLSLAQFEQCLKKIQGFVGTSDFWNNQNECNDFSRNVEDTLNDVLRPARDCAQQKRSIEDRKKEKKNNVDRTIKDILRENKNADVTALNTLLQQITEQFAKADQVQLATCNRDNVDVLRDVGQELNSLFQEWYNTSNDVRNAANQVKQLNDNKNDFEKNISKKCSRDMALEMKNFGKDVARAQKKGTSAEAAEALETVQNVYNSLCVDLIGAMKTALDANDVDTFNDVRNEFFTNERTFWDTMNEMRNGINEETQRQEQLKNVQQDLKFKEKELKRMNYDINRLKKLYGKLARKYASSQDRKEALDLLSGFIAEAEGLSTRMTEAIAKAKEEAPNDPDSYWFDRGDELNELQQEFNEIQNKANNYSNVVDNLQNIGKELKNIERSLSRKKLSAEKREQIQDILSKARDLLQEAWTSAIESPEDAFAAINEFQELKYEFEAILNNIDSSTFRGDRNGDRNLMKYAQPPSAGSSFSPPALPAPTESTESTSSY